MTSTCITATGRRTSSTDDGQVLYISTHQYPLYPGTGRVEETGVAGGLDRTVNIPLPPWSGDREYLLAFEEIIVPVARRFRPQIILVSAGYDAHWADNISSMQVTVGGYARMVAILKHLAEELCQGRIVVPWRAATTSRPWPTPSRRRSRCCWGCLPARTIPWGLRRTAADGGHRAPAQTNQDHAWPVKRGGRGAQVWQARRLRARSAPGCEGALAPSWCCGRKVEA